MYFDNGTNLIKTIILISILFLLYRLFLFLQEKQKLLVKCIKDAIQRKYKRDINLTRKLSVKYKADVCSIIKFENEKELITGNQSLTFRHYSTFSEIDENFSKILTLNFDVNNFNSGFFEYILSERKENEVFIKIENNIYLFNILSKSNISVFNTLLNSFGIQNAIALTIKNKFKNVEKIIMLYYKNPVTREGDGLIFNGDRSNIVQISNFVKELDEILLYEKIYKNESC